MLFATEKSKERKVVHCMFVSTLQLFTIPARAIAFVLNFLNMYNYTLPTTDDIAQKTDFHEIQDCHIVL